MELSTNNAKLRGRVRTFFAELGPGLITGAADDDPSGISTYSVAGASFGYLTLWTALFSFPLMAAVQLMCARLGLVTGRGLASVVRTYYSRPVLWGACALLMVANVFNIGADLGGMAEATEMMTGIQSYYWTPLYTLLIISLLFFSSYRHIARILNGSPSCFLLTSRLHSSLAPTGAQFLRRLFCRGSNGPVRTWQRSWEYSAQLSPLICSSGRQRKK
jgi:NRAMP (natural resistance-associated macrophage protein)-like metal ion transporter